MKKSAKRFCMVTALCGGMTALFVIFNWGAWEFEPIQRLEFYSQDLRAVFGVKTPIDTNLVFVGIDRSSYQASEFNAEDLQADPTLQLLQTNFPWSRAVWAETIRRLADAGAKVIVVDLVFPGQGNGDEALKQVLDKYKDRVVIGSNFKEVKTDRGFASTLDLPNASVLNADPSKPAAFDDRVGYVNIWPDWDQVLRRARYRQEGGKTTDVIPTGAVLESLDARALRKFGHPEVIPGGSDPILFRYTRRAGQGYRVHSIGDVLLKRNWSRTYQNGEFFRNKLVLIGPAAGIFQDEHRTPFPTTSYNDVPYPSEMLGPEIHLNIIGAALHNGFLRETPPLEKMLIIILFGVLALGLSFFVRQPFRRLVAVLALCVAYWFVGQLLFNRASLVIPVASPLLLLLASGVIVLGYDYLLEQLERARLRKTFERYVSKDIVKELLDNPQTYFNSLEGVRKRVTILFSDVRNFTSLTEASESEQQLVKQLNEYFEEMVRHVFGFKGTLDKFIGDAVMAVWGNIVTQGPERDAQHAVSTALEMKRSLVKLNADWKRRGLPELAFGIGINHGEAIVGNLGSTEKMEVTVIGDAVNLASRLEGLTKKYHLDLLLGENVAPLVRDRFLLRTVDFVQVKGKTKPVDTFTVTGERGAEFDGREEAWLKGYEEGVKLYRQRQFGEAADKFANCLRVKPDDYLAAMYRERCEALIRNPPGEAWDGVFVMTEK